MINLVASVAASGDTAGNTSSGGTTAPIDTTGANLLVAWVCGWINFGVLTDSKGNNWTPLPQHNNGNNGGHWVYCTAPIVGPNHVFTLSQVSYCAWIVYAFSGINALQVEVWATGSNVTSVASGSVTPAADGYLVLAAFTGANFPTLSVAPAELAATLQQIGSTPNANKAAVAHVVQSTAAAINPTWSWPTAQSNMLADTIVFTSGTPTAEGRVAQLPVEVLVLPSAPITAKLAQLPLEILGLDTTAAVLRVSQVAVEVLFAPPPSTGRVSQVALEVLWQPTSAQPARVSQVSVEVLYSPGGGGMGGEKVYVFLD